MGNAPDLVLRAAARLGKIEAIRPAPELGTPFPGEGTRKGLELAGKAAPQSAPAFGEIPAGRTVGLSPATLAANGIVLPSNGFSRRVEEFRSIKRQVLANVARGSTAPRANSNRLVMVTSAAPREGKTFISINLALAIAFERDIEVVLVDADAHRQSLLSYLGVTADKGWLDVLGAEGVRLPDVMLKTNIPNLAIVPAGKERPEIPELMSSREMATFTAELARPQSNRLVIFDSVPCLVSSEPSILAALVGQAVFVVAASETSKEEVESSLRLLEACPNVSLVLNKGNPALMEPFSRYEYGYGNQQNG